MDNFTVPYSNMIRIVKVIKVDSVAFSRGGVYRCLPCRLNPYTKEEGESFGLTVAPDDRAIFCASLNNTPLIENRYYIAYQLSPGYYVIHNHAVFLEL